MLQTAVVTDDKGWGLREPYTMMLLPFHELNQEKSFLMEMMGGDWKRFQPLERVLFLLAVTSWLLLCLAL